MSSSHGRIGPYEARSFCVDHNRPGINEWLTLLANLPNPGEMAAEPSLTGRQSPEYLGKFALEDNADE